MATPAAESKEPATPAGDGKLDPLSALKGGDKDDGAETGDESFATAGKGKGGKNKKNKNK